MNESFDPRRGAIVVVVQIRGPGGTTSARMLLDTGAAFPLIHPDVLTAIGIDLSKPRGSMRITTVTTATDAPIYIVDRITALNKTRERIGVLAYSLPSSVPVRGLLGLSFFRGRVLTLDFREGHIRLE